jgi:DNA-binding ferritin-like protein
MSKNDSTRLATHINEALRTPTDLGTEGVEEISASLRELLADVFALYVKTKNFHWHMSGAHFRDYHLLLDEQGEQIFEMTDDIAERARKIGGTTLHSIGEIVEHQRLKDNNAEFVRADPDVTKAVIHSSIEAYVRTPITRMPRIDATYKTPITRRPQQSHPRRSHPHARHPVIPVRSPRPVTR